MTVSLIKKKYIYFHLHHRKNNDKKIWYPQNNIIEEFEKKIDYYYIPEKHKENLKNAIFKASWLKMNDNKKEKTAIKWRITKLEKEKSGLIKMRRTGELTWDEFLEEKNNIINQIEDNQNKLIDLNRNDDSILSNLNEMVELFINLKDIRKTANNKKKLEIISKMVVELQIDNKKRLYIEENLLFRAFRLCHLNKWWSL